MVFFQSGEMKKPSTSYYTSLINKLEARSHDGKYYSCNSMRAIRAGLDIRNLNNENINFSTITDRVQAGK